jgi:hypothetical protein
MRSSSCAEQKVCQHDHRSGGYNINFATTHSVVHYKELDDVTMVGGVPWSDSVRKPKFDLALLPTHFVVYVHFKAINVQPDAPRVGLWFVP